MTVWSYNVPDGTYVFKFMCIYDVLIYSPEHRLGLGEMRISLGGRWTIFWGAAACKESFFGCLVHASGF